MIRGYHPDINYEQAQYQLHIVIICHAPVANRSDLAQAATEIEGVVTIHKMLTGENNLHIEAVGSDSNAIDRITGGV